MRIIFFTLLLTAYSFAFGGVKSADEPLSLFSDTNFDVSKTYHSLSILDTQAGNTNHFYVVVKIKQLPANSDSYKLYMTDGREVKEYEFSEINASSKTIHLGKMGFDEQGNLLVPFVIDYEIVLYLLKNNQLIKTPLSISNKDIVNVLYEEGFLYILDRRGNVSVFDMQTEDIKKIDDLSVKNIYDIKIINGLVYLIVSGYEKKEALFLVCLDKKKLKKRSLLKFDSIDSKALYDKYKIDLIENNILYMSINQKNSPGANPVSKIVAVNLDSNKIDYKFSEMGATSVVDIGLVCEKKPMTLAVYSHNKKNAYDQLFAEINNKKIELNLSGNAIIYDVEIVSNDDGILVFLIYQAAGEKASYATLATIRLNNKFFSCVDSAGKLK